MTGDVTPAAGDPQAPGWGGLPWSGWLDFDKAHCGNLIPATPGIYRFRARAETSSHVRSRSAWSSRHAARETRASTRRSRGAATIRSLIVTAQPAGRVQETGRHSGAHGSIITGTRHPDDAGQARSGRR